MKKVNKVTLANGAGLLLSIGGMIVTSSVTSKENEKAMKKFVDERLTK